MDLIELYHRRGISLVRSKLGRSPAARRGYGKLTRRYADEIEQRRAAHEAETPSLLPAL
ncbi:hypothetical protein [Sphingomonas sp.]|uniref:hypothetical protein n=1 Tax=Sphingomonas sp. TaxID=28214 RepID=UPI003B3B04E2